MADPNRPLLPLAQTEWVMQAKAQVARHKGKKRGVSESLVLTQILAYLETRHDLLFWRNNTGSVRKGRRIIKFGYRGSADILAVQAPTGRLIGIECKRSDGGVVSGSQIRWGDDLTRHGGVYLVARSVEEVREALGSPVVRLPGKRVYPGATADPDPDLNLK